MNVKMKRTIALGACLVAIAVALLLFFWPSQERKHAPVVTGMKKSEVLALRGQPIARRDCVLPEEFFVGAPAPYNCKELAPGNKYEEWTYKVGERGRSFVWFSHPTDPKENWVVVGSASISGGDPL